jgi:HSP20 family protein
MNTLSRWDPLREMYALQRMVNRMVDESFSGEQNQLNETGWHLPMDVLEKDEEFIVRASVPGLKPEDVDITFTNNTLTLQGETLSEEQVEEERYHLRERRYGKFYRSITFPTRVNGDAIDAHYENGELTLRLPKAEEVKPRRIAIKSGNGSKMIEGQAR